jgi:cupin superfamily acireductone dioxygenase involved in methionine salvage
MANVLIFPAHRIVRTPRQIADSHDLLNIALDDWNIGAEILIAKYESTISGLSDDNKQDCEEKSY